MCVCERERERRARGAVSGAASESVGARARPCTHASSQSGENVCY